MTTPHETDWSSPVLPEGYEGVWELWADERHDGGIPYLNLFQVNAAGRRCFVRGFLGLDEDDVTQMVWEWLGAADNVVRYP